MLIGSHAAEWSFNMTKSKWVADKTNVNVSLLICDPFKVKNKRSTMEYDISVLKRDK